MTPESFVPVAYIPHSGLFFVLNFKFINRSFQRQKSSGRKDF